MRQRELPFPTKMVVVSLPGAVLRDAVAHSRAGPADKERRAYLQLDDGVETVETAEGEHAIVAVGGAPFDAGASYSVAVPRNLLKGAFEIEPLVAWAKEHAASLPDEDAFVPALNLSYALGSNTGEETIGMNFTLGAMDNAQLIRSASCPFSEAAVKAQLPGFPDFKCY